MKIAIIGAGGHGRVVLDILRNNHQFDVVGFIDSNSQLHGSYIDGIPVLGDMAELEFFAGRGIGGAIVAIGDNETRCRFARIVSSYGISLINAIHPSASIARTALVGKNVVIAQGANICAHAKIEDSVICNTGCIIDHESLISEGAHICPGTKLAGHVLVHEKAFIGIGSTVIQNITIGQSATVGAGAVVLDNVLPETTVVGVPARPSDKYMAHQELLDSITESENWPTSEVLENIRKQSRRRSPHNNS